MLQPDVAGGGEGKKPHFKWGAKRGVARTNKSIQFYESFTYDGTEYRLRDCAYFYVYGQCETSIGKLAKMFETSEGAKKVKVFWFFRPSDIHKFLGGYEPKWDELFLACGDNKGVHNINDVEAIMGKCDVVCVSNDSRNPRPSRTELRRANYVFSRTFDTRLKTISKDFGDAIAGLGVENFFNKERDKQPLKGVNSSAAASSKAFPMKPFHSELASRKFGNRDGKLTSRVSQIKEGSLEDRAGRVHVKKNSPPVSSNFTSRGLKAKTEAFEDFRASGSSDDHKPSKKRKHIHYTPETDYLNDSGRHIREKKFIKSPSIEEKAPSQNIGKGSWYKKLPFEDELKVAIAESRFLLIENLEPSYTSLEVEDICSQAFKERVEAKMIPSSLMSSPHNGKALVIFKSTKAADSAMSQLTERCLILPNERPLVGNREVPAEIGNCRSFTGHLNMLDRSLMTFHKKNAVSTSHCAQPNHIVYPMAYEWLAQQEKSELKWKKLFEKQAKEIDIVRSNNN